MSGTVVQWPGSHIEFCARSESLLVSTTHRYQAASVAWLLTSCVARTALAEAAEPATCKAHLYFLTTLV